MSGVPSNEELLLKASRTPPIRLRISFTIMVATGVGKPKHYQFMGLHDTSIKILVQSPGQVWQIVRKIAAFCKKEFGGNDPAPN